MRSWAVAREAGAILRAQSGATHVRVFGSLADGDNFTERSDIDMAVGGLTPVTHIEALGRLLRLSPAFEFDPVDVERCPSQVRQRVEQSGVAV